MRITMMSSTLLAMAVAVMFVPANGKGFGHLHHHHQHHQLKCCGVPERSCISSSEECAVILPQYRCSPPWLTCCGNCISSNCSGSCRAAGTCLDDEFTVTDCGTYCDCCESCQADDCIGRCVGNPDLCFDDEYINGTCTGDNCTCCVHCGDPDSQCEEAGGLCVAAENECPCGYFPSPDFGCTSGDCICCVACIASRGCSGGHNPGRCVVNSTMCNADDEYISSDECASNVGECSCCKTCTPDQICAQEGGTCTKLSIGCASGFRKSILGGGCCTDECICCVPDTCNSTDSQCTPDAYGTECIGSCRNKRLQYETNDYCANNQTCCKACIPDPSCSEEGGICVTRNTGGCRGDLIESSNGKCCNSEFCACCVPNPQKSCWNATCLADDNPVVFQGGCNVIGDYRLKPDCGVACCKLCKPDSLCCSEGGRCYKGSCPPDLHVAPTGSCNDNDNCLCCV